MTNIAYIISQFEDEVKEAWELYFGQDWGDDDDFDERKEAFLQEEYNTIEHNSSECLDFTHYNLVLYLEMEKEVMDYVEGQDWDGYGIVKVVNMWKYMKAEEVLADITEMEEYDEDKKYICCDCEIDFTDQCDHSSSFEKKRKDRMYICMDCFDKE